MSHMFNLPVPPYQQVLLVEDYSSSWIGTMHVTNIYSSNGYNPFNALNPFFNQWNPFSGGWFGPYWLENITQHIEKAINESMKAFGGGGIGGTTISTIERSHDGHGDHRWESNTQPLFREAAPSRP
ncbi:hypothetical protein OSTOST_09341 [Ostertagia ostertagi]